MNVKKKMPFTFRVSFFFKFRLIFVAKLEFSHTMFASYSGRWHASNWRRRRESVPRSAVKSDSRLTTPGLSLVFTVTRETQHRYQISVSVFFFFRFQNLAVAFHRCRRETGTASESSLFFSPLSICSFAFLFFRPLIFLPFSFRGTQIQGVFP